MQNNIYQESQEQSVKARTKSTKPSTNSAVIAVIVLVIAVGVSFFAGVQYQKSNQPKITAGAFGGQFSTNGPGEMRMNSNRTVGDVTAVSSTSITIKNARSGSETTLTISSDTKITNNGSTATASDIKVGDTVFVTKDSSDANKAAEIVLNPGFGGAAPSTGSGATQSETVN